MLPFDDRQKLFISEISKLEEKYQVEAKAVIQRFDNGEMAQMVLIDKTAVKSQEAPLVQ